MFCEKTLTKFPNAGGSIFVVIFNGNGKEKQHSQLTSKWRLLILSYQRGCSFMLFHFITSFSFFQHQIISKKRSLTVSGQNDYGGICNDATLPF